LLNIDNKTIILLISITIFFSGLYTFIQFLFKFHPEKKISRFFFILFTFSKTVLFIFILIIGIYFIYNFYNTINQYLRILELKKYVKNLSRERVLAKISILSFSEDKFTCSLELYSLSGKLFKKSNYELIGTEFYIDFVVLNFEYLFIEKGDNNIAYPSVLFSDMISYDNGIRLLNQEEIKQYLNADPDKFIGLSSKNLNSISEFIFKCINNESFSKKNGVRSIIGSALHHKIFSNSIYKVYLQNTGGLVLIEENF